MKLTFEQIGNELYRLCIPFDGNIYTTVFALIDEKGCIIADSGSNEMDAINYVIPAMEKMGWKPDWFICTHLHGDHFGGLPTLLQKYPSANVGGFFDKDFGNEKGTEHFKDGQELYGRYQMIHLKGHSDDGLTVFDKKTKTLITGDCLQQYGITRFGTSVSDVEAYIQTLARVKELEPKTIIASHDYAPCGYIVKGTEEIDYMLSECDEAIRKICSFVKNNHHLDDITLSVKYREEHSNLPEVGAHSFAAAREFTK